MRRRYPLAPEPSRLRRATAAVRRWASRSAWRALGLVVALGTVAGLAFGFGITGPFWAQIAGWIVVMTLSVGVLSWIDAPSWQRAVVALLFFAPLIALTAVFGPMRDAAFSHENGYTLARCTGRVSSRTGGCTGLYAYDVDGTTYRSLISWGDARASSWSSTSSPSRGACALSPRASARFLRLHRHLHHRAQPGNGKTAPPPKAGGAVYTHGG
ncbi:MAG TPA: hypothetical protein VF594_05010, partial [Rubricoccaceae bacterium]